MQLNKRSFIVRNVITLTEGETVDRFPPAHDRVRVVLKTMGRIGRLAVLQKACMSKPVVVEGGDAKAMGFS